jgi:glycerol-1-phosphate dehydrogenase [NAD(P)+]
MELPARILVGEGVLDELGKFAADLGFRNTVLVVTGEHVRQLLAGRVGESLRDAGLTTRWTTVTAATVDEVGRVERQVAEDAPTLLIGLGGGKSVDVAKLAAFRTGRAFISAPTSASHDGIASPFASIKGLNRPYSFTARPPVGIVADVDVIARAPARLLVSGCGDLVAKTTAVRDWELARDEKGEYFGAYSASLARLSAAIILDGSVEIGQAERGAVRNVVEALISAGVAAGIAGSSRPCSGAEHLFSHALEQLAPGVGLHGEKCGLGTIIMALLHGLDWQHLVAALRALGAPTTAAQLGVDPDLIVRALLLAPTIRPDRYTILAKKALDSQRARESAEAVGVL